MIWAWLKRAPKIALVLGIIVGSTVIFGIWWIRHKAAENAVRLAPVILRNTEREVGEIEAAPDRMLFVDDDLYDVGTGEILFRGWLKESEPKKLFWEAESKTVLAQYEKGFIRYAPDGTERARFVMTYPFAISDDYKWIVFAKNKDIWQADINWQNLTLANERQITHVEQFNDAFFAESILLGTRKTLIVRAGVQVVRVSLDTGEVHPTRMPMLEIGKRKSPNGESIVGTINGQFYCLNVDSDLAKETPIGRAGINDYLWLGNDKCACIVNGKTIILYDREKNGLSEIANLPMQCNRIGDPSPDGRYVFCLGRGKGVLLDLEQRTVTPVIGGAGVRWVSDDTFAFSREVADSTFRGTWLQQAGESERRISPEPYLATNSGGEIMTLKAANLILFATEHGFWKSNIDGTDAKEAASYVRTPHLVLRMLTSHW